MHRSVAGRKRYAFSGEQLGRRRSCWGGGWLHSCSGAGRGRRRWRVRSAGRWRARGRHSRRGGGGRRRCRCGWLGRQRDWKFENARARPEKAET